MRVAIEPRKCIAAGQCVLKAPLVFDQGEEDGIVILLNEHPVDRDAAAARLAARVCPAGVIAVTED